ncbi:MAG: hypothetical protein U0984_06480 [Prosthecobacter sp.]|nr:hypothetical protein [Prosthecobacter sp.]
MTRQPLLALTLLVLSLSSCDQKKPLAPAPASPAPKAATAAASEKPAAEKVPAPTPALDLTKFPAPLDIGGFGSDEPVERTDLPSRGIIVLGPQDVERSNGAHWETFLWSKFKAKRWGRYQVRLTYTLNKATLGMQFRLGDLIVKKSLLAAPQPRKTYLGEVYIPQAGELPISLLTPPSDGSGFAIQELALIPAPEGAQPVSQSQDGSITLLAKDATTWSDSMRYEPKPEKNCLGYWTEPDDFAEWEFQVTKPGRYKVAVVHGCGGGNQGSEVEVKQNGQALKFTTQDTGGFQNWREVQVGEIEIKAAGRQRLVVDPVNKVKSAVLDVQKVVLTPVG